MATVPLAVASVSDEMTGLPAFSFLVPEGWGFASQIRWSPQTLMHPVTALAHASSASGDLRLDVHQNVSFVWAPSALAEGSQAFGLAVARPRAPVDHLLQIMLPQIRPGHGRVELQSVERDSAPPWGSTGPGRVVPGDDPVRVVVEYDWIGRRWREDLRFVVHVAAPQPMPTPRGVRPTQFWFVLPALSLFAPVDRWPDDGGLLLALGDSFRLNAAWIAALDGVFARIRNDALAAQQASFAAQQMAHRAQQRQFEAQRQIARTLQETSDIITSGWEARQETYDRVYDQQHLATMGVERYDDPSASAPVELEAGHVAIWGDGMGHYVYSDEESFDPNVGASGPGPNWQRLRRLS